MKFENVSRAQLDAAAQAIDDGQADCVLLRAGQPPLYGHGRGVRPLLQFLQNEPQQLQNAFLVDKIIGKAAAMLAVLGGVSGVWALTASRPALAFLQAHGVPAPARQTVEQIVNRTGDGLCPLEQSVLDLDDPAQAPAVLQKTIARLMAAK